jgi:hypothetical protein
MFDFEKCFKFEKYFDKKIIDFSKTYSKSYKLK